MWSKLSVLVFLVMVALWSEDNVYNIFTGHINCTTQCLHEEGHSLDTRNAVPRWDYREWISTSLEFQDAVQSYMDDYCFKQGRYIYDELCKLMASFPGIENKHTLSAPLLRIYNPTTINFWLGGWGGYIELYAEIYAYGVPEQLREFYFDT